MLTVNIVFNLEAQVRSTHQKQPAIYLKKICRITVEQQLIFKKQLYIWKKQQYIEIKRRYF